MRTPVKANMNPIRAHCRCLSAGTPCLLAWFIAKAALFPFFFFFFCLFPFSAPATFFAFCCHCHFSPNTHPHFLSNRQKTGRKCPNALESAAKATQYRGMLSFRSKVFTAVSWHKQDRKANHAFILPRIPPRFFDVPAGKCLRAPTSL